MSKPSGLEIRRALLSVSDKTGLAALGKALAARGVELVATGNTARVLREAGLEVTPIEDVSGSPEAFQGRMKTLSFPVCSGILYRRDDPNDVQDLTTLGFEPIDCVVVNFYPFEKAVESGKNGPELIEEVDIGGPTLVRAAAKNAPSVLVVTSPDDYGSVITELERDGTVSPQTTYRLAGLAWERVLRYDSAIARELGFRGRRLLRYGENPHQQGLLEFDLEGPIDWNSRITPNELSYNNILDLSSAYGLASDLLEQGLEQGGDAGTGVVIVKHNNPCGVAWVPSGGTQSEALELAWAGDPVSAFGGVVVFTHPLTAEAAAFLGERFVEVLAAPGLGASAGLIQKHMSKRKGLKAVEIRRFSELPRESMQVVPGGRLFQTTDTGGDEEFKAVSGKPWTPKRTRLAQFGVGVCRALKSNAVVLVRELPNGAFQLVGAGQGQPNRVEALERLAIPRAQSVLTQDAKVKGSISDCILISDAFFPFRDTVDGAAKAGIRWIVQPGGSMRDAESISACDEHGIGMVFTGRRHFRH